LREIADEFMFELMAKTVLFILNVDISAFELPTI